MSTRLTNDTRESIARSVLRHRFTEQVDALIAERATLADALYNDIYRKSDREKMDALPVGWLPEVAAIGIQFGSSSARYENITFNGVMYGKLGGLRTVSDAEKSSERRVFNRHRSGCVKVYDDQHKLSTRYQELESRRKALDTEYEAARRQTESALANIGTIKRLTEVWPEMAPFAKPFDNGPRNLPSLPTAKLNEMLGLPVGA